MARTAPEASETLSNVPTTFFIMSSLLRALRHLQATLARRRIVRSTLLSRGTAGEARIAAFGCRRNTETGDYARSLHAHMEGPQCLRGQSL
jgi:hypothetical protein